MYLLLVLAITAVLYPLGVTSNPMAALLVDVETTPESSVTVSPLSSSRSQNKRSLRLCGIQNTKMNINELKTINAVSRVECALQCLGMEEKCGSLAYEQNSNTCILYSAKYEDVSCANYSQVPGWKFMSPGICMGKTCL